MKRVTLYSRSIPARTRGGPAAAASTDAGTEASVAPAAIRPPGRLTRFYRRFERPLLVSLAALCALLAMIAWTNSRPTQRALTQKDIDAAVMHTLENNALPSMATRAYEAIRGSVVRVNGVGKDPENADKAVRGVGTGVVIVDKGIILTNLHVVAGADTIRVVFHDGTESEATLIGVQAEDDLAVIKAKTIPDDLTAATLRSTADLAPGDQVVAVGFPFGIGPSASAGVVSGLKREYRSPEGKRVLTNLIQFDAAVNPGNSGGPLVTADGEVVGIVTGILNPTDQRVFIGIGFAVPIENAAGAVGVSPF
jgi:S1-C subfamily serine protease